MSASFKAHGPSRKQMNILFACLFGLPVLTGAGLAVQDIDFTKLAAHFKTSDTPVALSAEAEPEPHKSFTEMMDLTSLSPQGTLQHEPSRFEFSEVRSLEPAELDELTTGSLQAPEAKLASVNLDDMAIGTQSPAFAPSVPVGESFSGKPMISEAIVLSFGQSRLRLAGLDAPPAETACKLLSGEQADCRQAASEQLAFFLSFRDVSCQVTATSADGAPLAQCRLGGSDIAEWLVRRGWASPTDMTDPSYRAAALFAQSYRLGQYRQ